MRKFCITTSIIILFFLFISGIFILFNYDHNMEKNGGSNIFGFNNESSKNSVNILLLIGDKSEINTDVIVVINYNINTAKINILSIPRDTKVNIKSKIPKINSAYDFGGRKEKGIKYTSKAINGLLDIKINYYIYLNLAVFREVIDKFDGVDFYVPENLNYDDPTQDLHIHLRKGFQHLNGKKAEQLLRYRGYNRPATENFDGSDIGRINMQQKFIKEFISQKANIFYISKLNEIINYVFDNVQTDMKLDVIFKLIANIQKINSNKLDVFRLSGDEKYIKTPTYNNAKISYFIYNKKILNVNTKEEYSEKEVLEQYFIAK